MVSFCCVLPLTPADPAFETVDHAKLGALLACCACVELGFVSFGMLDSLGPDNCISKIKNIDKRQVLLTFKLDYEPSASSALCSFW